ncbi:MAG TPA: TolC family protein, partial [Chthoniobacteraceae bacterium]|nr:TolC family protein [Chthoniobacteraceae bacterium]
TAIARFLARVLGCAIAASCARAEAARTISIEQAYDIALATDQSIRIAYWEVRKANLLPWAALTRLGPQLNGNASYRRREASTTASVLETGAVSSFERTTNTRAGTGDIGLTFQQPLIDLTVFPAYRLGKLSAEVAKLQRQFTVRETLFGVTSAYFEVLKQERLVAVNREALRLANEQLDLAQKRADVGEVTRSDVLRALVTVETARRTLVESENGLELDRNTLGNILNLAPNAPFSVIEPPDYPSTLPLFDELLSRAYSHREDFRVKELAIGQDTERRNEIIGKYAPSVVAQWDGDINRVAGSSSSSNRDWQATIAVQVPILTGGQREIDLRTAGHQIEETKLDRDKTAKTVEADVKAAWLNVRTLQQTLKALHTQVVAAEQGWHDLENQYAAGTATSVDVLTALNDLNTARKDLAIQTYDFQVALRNLEQVSGVFQEPRVQASKIK